MRDYSVRLLKTDPVKLGSKALDLYWKKAIYETYNIAKSLKVEISKTL